MIYVEHDIQQTFTLKLIITNLVLLVLNQDVLDFGTLETNKERQVTPPFN